MAAISTDRNQPFRLTKLKLNGYVNYLKLKGWVGFVNQKGWFHSVTLFRGMSSGVQLATSGPIMKDKT